MGTRTKGEFQKFAKVNANKEEAKILKKYLQSYEIPKNVVDALSGFFLVSNPYLELLETATKVAFPIYEGVKEYKETGNIQKTILETGKNIALNDLTDIIMPKAISSIIRIIVPPVVEKSLPRDRISAANRTKIIENAATVAGGLL